MSFIITPPDSPTIFEISNFSIRYYGFIMSLVFLIGVVVSYFLFKNKLGTKDADVFIDYSPLVIIFSIIGARLFYVFASLNFYLNNPLEILMINHGGLSIFGAILFGVLSLYALSKINKFNFLAHIDIIAVVFPLCQAIGRFGNYFNQEAYGKPTNGVIRLFVDEKFRRPEFINVEYYHPTFLYESILDLFIFIFLFILFMKNKKDGTIVCWYLILYSIVRFIIEGIRIDSVLNIGQIPIARVLSLIIFLVSIVFLMKNKCRIEN